MKYVKYLFIISVSAFASISNGQSAATASAPTPSVNKGDRPGHDMTAPIPAELIPPAPVLNVEDAIKSMQVQPGFVVEKVASEPIVFSPVQAVFDPDGRIWAVEMTTYMPDLDGNNEEVPEGTIVILEDTDKDGVMDTRKVIFDDIVLPRTVSLVKGGILYADHEQLYFAEILENDEVGLHEVVDPLYAKGGNVEHKPNGMLYSLDNWYYNAKSTRRYKTLPLSHAIPKDSEEIYRNKYWKMVVAQTENRGQWGISVDDYGRLYHNGNGSPATAEYLRPNSLMKNPGLRQPVKAHTLGTKNVYPIRITPGVNRAYLPNILIAEGPNKGKLRQYTGAAGSAVYRGDQFPEAFYGDAFTPESAVNLISIRNVIEQDGQLLGENAYPEAEVLASTDERFRPTNVYTAPDGSLYIIDMYHGIIQHKEFLTTYLREQYESRGLDKNNRYMGRVYRLRWKDKPLGPQPNMSKASPEQLVAHLSHSNGWWRDTARQLLVQNEHIQAISSLRKLASDVSADHRANIAALWTLEGLQGLDLQTLMAAMQHGHSKVRVSAIELSTRLDDDAQMKIAEQLLNMTSDDYEVALQIALIAGELEAPNSFVALEQILQRYNNDPLMMQAAISGLTGKEKVFAAKLDSNAFSEFLAVVDAVGREDIVNSNVLTLPDYQQESYHRGKALYDGSAACFGCHGQDGSGIDNMGPPLAPSEWVSETPEQIVKVLLHGLMGPISVNGVDYDGSMVMPGFANSLNDQELADISTYIRNNWGNTASRISAATVKRIRSETDGRQMPYQQSDFPSTQTEQGR